MATLGNPKNTIAVLQKYQFNFQKKFGQNFLIDTGILEEIIEAAQITKDDFVLEIGPGIGTMTQYLCEAARAVVAVEIDTNLIPILKDTLAEYNNVDVLNEDILKVNISKLAEEKNNGKPIKVVANLPYYITTPIIMGLFESHVPLESITIMVQKEVAERMQEIFDETTDCVIGLMKDVHETFRVRKQEAAEDDAETVTIAKKDYETMIDDLLTMSEIIQCVADMRTQDMKAIREFGKFVPAFAAFEKNRLSLYREAAKEAEEIFDRWADEIDDFDEDFMEDEDYEPDEYYSD